MEENTYSFFSENIDEVNPLSGQQQEEIHFLKEGSSPNCIEDDQSLYSIPPGQLADFLERYKGIEGIELIAEDDEIKHLLRQFKPESLLKL